MFFNNKSYYCMGLTEKNLYSGTDIENISINDTALSKKYNNKALMLLDTYQFISIDVPPGTNIESAKKIIGFKIKEYIDFPLELCVFDILPTSDEQNQGKYYVAVLNKEVITAVMSKYNIQNIKIIDFLENALLNMANKMITSQKASLVIYNFETYTYILLMYKKKILSTRKIEVSDKDLDLWLSEVQRSFDIFERQYRFTTIEETIVVNLNSEQQDTAKIILKDPKFKTIKTQQPSIPNDVYIAMQGLICRI